MAAQIGAADADDNQDIRLLLDFLCSSLNACEFFLIIFQGQVYPAEEVIARAGLFQQHLVAGLDQRVHVGNFFFLHKRSQTGHFQFHCHINFHLFP